VGEEFAGIEHLAAADGDHAIALALAGQGSQGLEIIFAAIKAQFRRQGLQALAG
jgi:hypothetical protein